jgi:hypothetical protein
MRHDVLPEQPVLLDQKARRRALTGASAPTILSHTVEIVEPPRVHFGLAWRRRTVRREVHMGVIGLDLAATNLAGPLFVRDGGVPERSGARVAPGTKWRGRSSSAPARLRAAEARQLEVDAIGVSVPRIAHHQPGTAWTPNLAVWDRHPTLRMLGAELGSSRPVWWKTTRLLPSLGARPYLRRDRRA